MRGRVTRVCAADPLTQQTANVRSRPVDGELMGWELIKSSPVSSHQSSCITMCWQLPPPPIRRTSLTQLLPNTHWFCFLFLLILSIHTFVGSVSPLSQCFGNKFHPMFCTYSLVPLPPLAFPLTTVRCRVPPPLDRLSPNCQYGHFPTCALNERPTNRCSMVGPLILGRERRHYQPTKWPLSDPKHDKVHSQPIVCFDQ